MHLVGKHNRRVSEIRMAMRRGTLTPDGRLPLEGPHLCREAMRTGIVIDELYLADDAPVPDGVEARSLHRVPASSFRTMVRTRESQGVIGLVVPTRTELDEVLERAVRKAGPVVVLCGVQDPGNVGTILRSADAFDAAGVVATPGTASATNDKVVRASAGSLLRVRWVWNVDFRAFADSARTSGIRLLGLSSRGENDLEAVDYGLPTALLIGSEGVGLSDEEAAGADALVRIPHRDAVNSLNAASAATIALYRAFRRAGEPS